MERSDLPAPGWETRREIWPRGKRFGQSQGTSDRGREAREEVKGEVVGWSFDDEPRGGRRPGSAGVSRVSVCMVWESIAGLFGKC